MIDILALRDSLNELAFRRGQRRVFLGRISDNVQVEETEGADEDDQAQLLQDSPQAIEYVRTLERELQAHDLLLARGEDPDELYAVQLLRQETNSDMTWMAEGMKWVSRITTVALEMVIPGIIGAWLDHYFRTHFLAVLGFLLGMAVGLGQLIQMTRRNGRQLSS